MLYIGVLHVRSGALASAERAFALLDQETDVKDRPRAQPAASIHPAIQVSRNAITDVSRPVLVRGALTTFKRAAPARNRARFPPAKRPI
jgi:hypothetical protein